MLSTASNRDPLALELQRALAAEPVDLARAALVVAAVEYPSLDPAESLAALDRLGARARQLVTRLARRSTHAKVAALNALVFEEEGFAGNVSHYDDFRNSYLNVVLERRLGIPITLALVYMEIARRANVDVQGVAFPGHFLMRVPQREGRSAAFDDGSGRPEHRRGAGATSPGLILDPFGAGHELDAAQCRVLLGRHLGTPIEETPFDPALLEPCTPRQMVARMLNNLKRTYVELRAWQRARRVTGLLLALDPTNVSELRDRGLLALQLEDVPAALRDLEDYCRVHAWRDEGDQQELQQLRDQIAQLRRRIGSLN